MKKIYLVLAILLLVALAPMPYGYFQIVRLISTVVFGMMAYGYYKVKKETMAYVCGGVALLFQPFYKIVLGRVVWNVIDVVVAIGLIILFLAEQKHLKKN